MRTNLLVVGIIILIIGIISVNIFNMYANDCYSTVGKIFQFFSPEHLENCQIVVYASLASGVIAFSGIVMIIWGVIAPSAVSDRHQSQHICAYCNFIAMTETELLKHNSEKHLDKSPYKCGHCDFIGITEEILWNHYNDEHPNKKKW
jgi:hypothetical protein